MKFFRKQLLGSGAYGSVYALSDERWVVKQFLIDSASAYQNYKKETHFLKSLQSLQYFDPVSGLWQWICPQIKHTERKGKLGIHVMERMTASLHMLGQLQAKKCGLNMNCDLVYSEMQLRQVANLCEALDKWGIVHGDLKRRNILFSWTSGSVIINKSGVFTTPLSLRVVDFGFSGIRPSNATKEKLLTRICKADSIGYPASIENLEKNINGALPNWILQNLNRWQLFYDLLIVRNIYIERNNVLHPITPYELQSIFQVPSKVIDRFWRFFPGKLQNEFEWNARRRGTRLMVRSSDRSQHAGKVAAVERTLSNLVDGTRRTSAGREKKAQTARR